MTAVPFAICQNAFCSVQFALFHIHLNVVAKVAPLTRFLISKAVVLH